MPPVIVQKYGKDPFQSLMPLWLSVAVAPLGIVAYAVIGTLFEAAWTDPVQVGDVRLSYGQAWGIIMVPLAGIYSAGFGAFGYLLWRGKPVYAASLLLLWTLLIGLAVTGAWSEDYAINGYDDSHVVLYAPFVPAFLMGASATIGALLYAIIIRLVGTRQRGKTD